MLGGKCATTRCSAGAALVLLALLQLYVISVGSSNHISGRFRARLASARHVDHHTSEARHGGVDFRSVLGSTASRDLLQTAQAPLCVFDGGYCWINAAYPTTLLGTPRTDTQKLIAYTSWLADRRCDRAASKESCKQLYDNGQSCTWISADGDCTLTWWPPESWFRGNLFCPGSLADSAATCTAAYFDRTSPYNTTATVPQRCASRPGCVWLPGSAVNGTANGGLTNGDNVGLTVSDVPVSLLIPSLLAPYYDRPWSDELFDIEDPSITTGACVPQWVVEAQGARSKELESRTDARELRALLAGRTTDAADLYLPVYDELFGTCTGAQRAKQYLSSANASCWAYEDFDPCEERAACGWSDGLVEGSPYRSEGRCQVNTGFVWELLYDPNDTWIQSIKAAEEPCVRASLNSTECASAGGTIPVNYAVLESYSTVRPSWMLVNGDGAGGGGANGGGGGGGVLGEGGGGGGGAAHAAAPATLLTMAVAVLVTMLVAAAPGAL